MWHIAISCVCAVTLGYACSQTKTRASSIFFDLLFMLAIFNPTVAVMEYLRQ